METLSIIVYIVWLIVGLLYMVLVLCELFSKYLDRHPPIL